MVIHKCIKDLESATKDHLLNTAANICLTLIPKLHKFINNNKTSNNKLDGKILMLLKSTNAFCKKNPHIIFTWADKGNVTVAMHSDLYNEKMHEMLLDTNTYTIKKKDLSSKIEKDFNNLLKNW